MRYDTVETQFDSVSVKFFTTPALPELSTVEELVRQMHASAEQILTYIHAQQGCFLFIGKRRMVFKFGYAFSMVYSDRSISTIGIDEDEDAPITSESKEALRSLVNSLPSSCLPKLLSRGQIYLSTSIPKLVEDHADWKLIENDFNYFGFSLNDGTGGNYGRPIKMSIKATSKAEAAAGGGEEDDNPWASFQLLERRYGDSDLTVDVEIGKWKKTSVPVDDLRKLPLFMSNMYAAALVCEKMNSHDLRKNKVVFDLVVLECFLMAGVELPAYRGGDVRQEIVDHLTKHFRNEYSRPVYAQDAEGMAIELHGLAWAARETGSLFGDYASSDPFNFFEAADPSILFKAANHHLKHWPRIANGLAEHKRRTFERDSESVLWHVRLAHALGFSHKATADKIAKISVDKLQTWRTVGEFGLVANALSTKGYNSNLKRELVMLKQHITTNISSIHFHLRRNSFTDWRR